MSGIFPHWKENYFFTAQDVITIKPEPQTFPAVNTGCGCNEFGAEDNTCDAQGKCKCKCDVCGDKCDECCIGFYGLTKEMNHCHGIINIYIKNTSSPFFMKVAISSQNL